jgi:hypothetical protein
MALCTAVHFTTVSCYGSEGFGFYGLNEVFIPADVLTASHQSFLGCSV